jgi:branched-subunit amino acid transport protein
MSRPWTLVLVVGACTVAFKAMGPVVLGGRELPHRIRGVVDLLAPTLLAALVVVSTFASGQELVLDARAAAIVAAVGAVALRAPIIVVVTVAAVVAAVIRLL